MFDWHSCQICYPLAIKILLLLFIVIKTLYSLSPPPVMLHIKGHLCLRREDSLKEKYNTKYFKINFYLIFI